MTVHWAINKPDSFVILKIASGHKVAIGTAATTSTFQLLRKWREEAKGMYQLSYPYFVGTLLKPHKELLLVSPWPKVSYVVSYFQVRMGNDFFFPEHIATPSLKQSC